MRAWIKIIFTLVVWTFFPRIGAATSKQNLNADVDNHTQINIKGANWQIHGPQGPLPIRIVIESKYKGAKAKKKTIDDWHVDASNSEVRADVTFQGMQWRIVGTIEHHRIQFETYISGKQAPLIEFERVWLETKLNRLEHLGRDYKWHRLKHKYAIDRWTPQLLYLRTGSTGYRLAAKANSVWLEKKGRYKIAIELDHHKNHPLKLYSKCFSSYRLKQKDEKRKHYAQPASKARRALFSIYFQDVPLIEPLRYPQRFRSALAITDHADRSSAKKLRALMLGSSGAPVPNRKGFAGNGLSMSKSIFATMKKGYQPQGDSFDYISVLREIQTKTLQEIGLHSISGAKDDREATEAGLIQTSTLQKEGMSRFWIDHQPSTNCEAISNEGSGFRKGSRQNYGIVDLLKKYQYDYVWAGFDRSAPKDGINLFDPARPQSRTPILYSHNGVDNAKSPIMLFLSLWRATPHDTFLRSFSSKKLNRLTRDRGLHIAHTYMDAYDYGRHKRWKTLLKRVGPEYVIRPTAERLFADLGRRQQKKEIWVAGIGAIGSHLKGMAQLEIDVAENGTITLYNPSQHPINGASFRIPPEADADGVWIDNRPLHSEDWAALKEGLEFQIDIGAGQRRIVTVRSPVRKPDPSDIRIDVNSGDKP